APSVISERIAELDSSRTGAAECVVWSSVKLRLVEERVEDVAIAETTNSGCIPGKDRTVEHVEEVDTNFKLVAFPWRERHSNGFRETQIEPVPTWSTKCIPSHDSSTNVGIDYKTCIVERDWSNEIIGTVAGWRFYITEAVGNRHRVARSVWITNRRPIVGIHSVLVNVKTT